MKALSIKQPWASLIANGIKDIENRTWQTKFRGRIYIHASAKSAGHLLKVINEDQESKLYKMSDFRFLDSLEVNSAIIGEVDIVDCVINHPSIWAEKTPTIYKKPSIKDEGLRGYYEALKMFKENKPIYNWVLANPVLYKKPILNVKGKLSLWEFENNIK